MDRRIALKNMGLALGYTVATPTLLSLMQGCKEVETESWTPEFFSSEEGKVLIQLIDIILPKTDTPSASEVNVHVFIDRFTKEIVDEVQQDLTKISLNKFIQKALQQSGKAKVGDLTTEDLEPLFVNDLNAPEEEDIENMELMIKNTSAASQGENDAVADEMIHFSFAKNLREMTIWGYKTSEYVAENVLAYLPIPGEYIPCGDVNELTGGKDWAL